MGESVQPVLIDAGVRYEVQVVPRCAWAWQ